MRARYLIALLLILVAAGFDTAHAQDVLTVGSGVTTSGLVVSVPVSIRDRSATPLGTDAGAGNRIQGFAFKILFPDELIASVSFARAGVTAGLTPLFENTLQGGGWISYVVAFRESTSPIPFVLNAADPGNQVGTLTVTFEASAPSGSAAVLTLHPASATLSNQAGTTLETVANGNLSPANGTVSLNAFGPPSNLVAAATSPTQVHISWGGVAGASRYDIYRSADGGGLFTFLKSATGTSTDDPNVAANTTYLYRAQSIDGGGGASAFSNIDVATTVIFTDDPLAAGTTNVKAIHITQLRTAVNAMRAAAALAPLGADPTIGVGLNVRAQHINDLRTGLAAARSAMGLAAISYTDSVLTPGSTLIKVAHIEELRNGVK